MQPLASTVLTIALTPMMRVRQGGGSKPLLIHGSLPTPTLDPCPRCCL
ncbi:hypothetical protein H6F86_07165 [Phormidium sp. FACHB-592]|uniref:Uncharacterized protein n=1 Tax=Stenomitos frigidus AS-A4 TaxID=2933935 RepID=A0ABV0KT59_9CYAN|nr:hypothetical protein [Phormidium sp. FACHB-592]